MARIVFGSYMVRYPLGGMLSWALQYLLGMKALGHDVYLVEKSGYDRACYNPVARELSNDCRYGIGVVSELLERFGLGGRWCFVDEAGDFYGLGRTAVDELFETADLFIDSGSHGSWAREAERSGLRVLIDGEPGYTQIKWANRLAEGTPIPEYDRYFTNGKNIGAPGNPVPTLGITWEYVYSPVDTSVFTPAPSDAASPYSTVMNWQSHAPIAYNGCQYGQKDIEFQKFMALPADLGHPMEVAVSGDAVPVGELERNGWTIEDAHQVTMSFDSFRRYLSRCRGEFSVCKNVFVALRTGWFSDKSAAYLASGRPVVLQDTGFSRHLPVGEGLFACDTAQDARSAILAIEADYAFHSRRAREIACEHLEARTVMKAFLAALGL